MLKLIPFYGVWFIASKYEDQQICITRLMFDFLLYFNFIIYNIQSFVSDELFVHYYIVMFMSNTNA